MTADREAQRQRLLEAVVTGERATSDPEIRAACASDPTLAAELQQLLELQATLHERAAAVREDLTESAGPLHGNAAAALRAALQPTQRSSRRPWPWLAVAAAALVAVAWWSWPATTTPSVPQFLGGIAVRVTDDGQGLELRESVGDTQSFRIVVRDATDRELRVFPRVVGRVWTPPADLVADWQPTWRVVLELRSTEVPEPQSTVVTGWMPGSAKR